MWVAMSEERSRTTMRSALVLAILVAAGGCADDVPASNQDDATASVDAVADAGATDADTGIEADTESDTEPDPESDPESDSKSDASEPSDSCPHTNSSVLFRC